MASPFSEFADSLLPSRKALVASATVLEAAQDRVLNLNAKLAVSAQVRAAWMQFQTAGYGYIYGHQPAVRSVIDYIATNVVELGPKLYRYKSAEEREEVSDHPAAEVLRNPNPWTPGRQFIFDVFADFLTYNNAYALKVKPDPQGRLFLLCVPASAVAILGRGVYELAGYQIFRTDGSNFTVQPEDMIHWRGYNAVDRRMGISKLETLRAELSEQAATQRANVDLMESGLQQRGYIKRSLDAPDWRKDGGKDRFIEEFRAAMQRADRGYPVLEEGMEIAPLGVSPKDAEMLSSRTLFNDEVASQYGMVHCPPEGEEERRQFYADVLPPLCALLCDFLRVEMLQNEFMADDLYFEFNLDKKQLSDNRLMALTSAAGVPPLLRNEARAMLNLPPVKDGDQPITPLNVLVGGKPSPGAMPPQNPLGPPQDGSHRTDQPPLPPAPPKALKAQNWVQQQGGLPKYIHRIADHLKARGMTESHAIAVAVNAARRMCATGDVNFPGKQNVNPGSRAEACAAISEWEAMKARAHASALEPAMEFFDEIDGELYLPVMQYLELEQKFRPDQPRNPHTGEWIREGGGVSAENLLGVGINEPGPGGAAARAAHEVWLRHQAEANRAALEQRNPDMKVTIDALGAYQLEPKKGTKLSPEELRRRNPDYDPPPGSRIHKLAGVLHHFFMEPPQSTVPSRAPAPTGGILGRSGEIERKQLEITTQPRVYADMARQRRNIDEATGTLQNFYHRQSRSLAKKAMLGKAFDSERWNAELTKDLAALFFSIIDREGGIYTARLGGVDFDMRTVTNYIKATATKLAERINEATQQDVESGTAQDAIERAQEERAAIAGRGIGTKATIFAREEAAKQAPFYEMRTKTWVKDTERHAHLDGITVGIDQDWGGIRPGSEPNCACTATIE